MSETTPLLPQSVRNNLPSQRTLSRALPSPSTRIQLSSAVGAFSAGKVPSQAQLSSLIDLAIESDFLKPSGGAGSKTARLGVEGTRVLESTKEVLKALKAWGEEKNGDDVLQNLVYNASHANAPDVDLDVNLSGPSIETTPTELGQDTLTTLKSLSSLVTVFLTSPSSIHTLDSFVLLSRDLLSDSLNTLGGNIKAGGDTVAPSEKEKEEGKVDWDKAKDKGIEVGRHTATGLYKAQAKEKAIDKAIDAKHWADENVPPLDEIKDSIISRLKTIVTEAQRSPEYKQSIRTLLSLFKKYVSKAQAAAKEVKENVDVDGKVELEDEDEEALKSAGRDVKTFVERVAGKSLDPLLEAAKKASNDVKEDPKLQQYFDELSNYFDRVLDDEDYVTSQRAYRKASSLYDEGQELIKSNETWKADADALQKEINVFLSALGKDKVTADLVDAVERLGEDLADAGSVGLSSLKNGGIGLYRDFTDVVLPRIISLVKEIPVPRIEFKSADVDLVIDDLKLESASFIPDSVKLVQRNDFLFSSGYAAYASEYDGTVRLAIKGLHFAASNIAYWFHKKSGYFQFEDSGLLDFVFGPKGISADVTLETAGDKDRETFFTVKGVKVSIEGFDYTIRENNHWFATWISRPVVRTLLLTVVTHAIEVQIKEGLRSLDFQLYGLQQRTIAATNAKPTPANYIKAMFKQSVFPQSSSMGPTKLRPAGFQKVGPRGAFIVSVGMDEDMFPNKPEGSARNQNRAKLQAKVDQAKKQSKAKGKTVASAAKNDLDKIKGQAESERRTLTRAAREQARRENRTEGWRSDVFDVSA